MAMTTASSRIPVDRLDAIDECLLWTSSNEAINDAWGPSYFI